MNRRRPATARAKRTARRVGRAALAALALAGAAQARDPAIDYALECRGCHLGDGAGSGAEVPDLRNSVGNFTTVPGGRAYLVRVPGASQAPLDDAALAEVLNYMIRRFGPVEVALAFEPYDAAEVARYRAEPLVEVEAERARLLARLAAGER